MTFPHSAAGQAVPITGGSARRWLAVRLLSVVAVCAVVALGAAACGSRGSGGKSKPLSPTQALMLAASQARKVTSVAASLDILATGTYSTHLTGSVVERVKPSVLADEKFSISANGHTVPGGMEGLLTSNAMYLKLKALRKTLGRPWVKISFAKLKGSTGISLAPLIHQLQGNNPLVQAQMLRASSHVHRAGTATINGVPTTAYAGTLNLRAAMSKLGPGLRKLFNPALAATGITTAQFTVWIDGQHQVRKLVEHESGTQVHVTVVMVINSINQPVHITVPPASQVATPPGL